MQDTRARTRATIVECAARLLREQGAAAVTTRAVAQAAGMQAPTIYRFFEDKEALLDAVAEHVFATYLTGKAWRCCAPGCTASRRSAGSGSPSGARSS